MNKRKFSLGDILRKINEDKEVSPSPEESSVDDKPQEIKQKFSIPKFPDIKEPVLENDFPLQPEIGRPAVLQSEPALDEPQVLSNEKTDKKPFRRSDLNEKTGNAELKSDNTQEQSKPSAVPKLSHLISEKKDDEEEEEFDLFRYIGIIIRRKNAVLAVTLLLTIISIFKYLNSDKYYISSARLLFRPDKQQMLGVEDPWTYFSDREKTFNTHLELLKSNTVLELVAQNLDNKVTAAGIRSGLSLKQGETDGQKNDIIELSLKYSDPEMARDILNELCNTYIEYRRNVNGQEITRLIGKFEVQIAKLQNELDLKEGDLRRFKEENKMVQLSSETDLTVQKLTDMELALQQTQLSLVESKQKLSALNSQIGQQEQNIVQSITYQDPFQNHLSDLELQLNTLSAEYSPEHYKVKMIKEQIEKLKAAAIDSLTREASSRTLVNNPIRQSLVQSLVNLNVEVAALETKRIAQEKIITSLNLDLLKLPSMEQKFAYLQRETSSLVQTLEMLKSKYEEAKIRRDSQESDLKVLELAQTPRTAISSVKLSNLFIGILIGLILGIALAFLLEYLDQSLKDPLDVEKTLELPLLGIVPLIEAEKGLVENTSDLTKSVLEPFRALRANLKHIAAAHELKTFIVCSAVKGEGKTTLAANLAITFSLDGKKVILVDGDLRRSQMHTLFNIPKQYGFADYLLGTMALDEIIKPTRFERLSVITSGERPHNPAELLGTCKFDEMLNEIRNKADIIIFDSPALLPVSDTITMAPKMDGCVIVTRTFWTPLKAAKQAKNQLKRIGCHLFGGILNGVSQPRGYYPYYYGYYGYYSYKYSYEDDHKTKFSIREFGLEFEKNIREFARSIKYSFPRYINAARILATYLTRRKTFWILLITFMLLSSVHIWFRANPRKLPDESIRYLGIVPAGSNMQIDNRGYLPKNDIAAPPDVQSSESSTALTSKREDSILQVPSQTLPSTGISDSLKIWADALSSANIERYLSFYNRLSFQFSGGGFPEWREDVLKKLTSSQNFKFILDSISQGKSGASFIETTIYAKQISESDSIRTVHRLIWQIGPEGWRIVREKQ
jgi:succinoglycan biosynthesis transport protein ExoP